MIFNDRQKHSRWQQSPYRMLPANESLNPHHHARAHVHFGLVIEDKFPCSKCAANMLKVFVPATHTLVMIGIEDVVAVSARQFGLVNGLVGLPQQKIRSRLFRLGEERASNTCGNTKTQIANLHL